MRIPVLEGSYQLRYGLFGVGRRQRNGARPRALSSSVGSGDSRMLGDREKWVPTSTISGTADEERKHYSNNIVKPIFSATLNYRATLPAWQRCNQGLNLDSRPMNTCRRGVTTVRKRESSSVEAASTACGCSEMSSTAAPADPAHVALQQRTIDDLARLAGEYFSRM
jgi:hypothetical protein